MEAAVFTVNLMPAQRRGHFTIRRCHPNLAIYKEEHRISLLDGSHGLGLYLLDEIGGSHRKNGLAAVGGINPAGVHHTECSAIPGALGVDPIARSSRHIINNGQPLSNQPVEEGALAHIWASYQRNDRFRHVSASMNWRAQLEMMIHRRS
jgi:hypothetical protein